MNSVFKILAWGATGTVGAVALALLASSRGETVNSAWVVVAAVCVCALAYRFYARFVGRRVLRLDADRTTPAVRRSDGLDYVPTNRVVVFGHHFAAIAGAGPLVGPVLAAQLGYLPGLLWILVGAVFAGCVQDMIVLFLSVRRDGRSLGEIIRMEMGRVPGIVALIGVLMIMIILLAVLALVVLKALAGSPWGTFTVAATIPIALFMGAYTRYLRPGRITEVSIIGFVLLMAVVSLGGPLSRNPDLAPWFTFRPETLAFLLMGYGFVASALPVWLLLAPRDYLSTFLKIGTILGLGLGILVVRPELHMPAVTRFIDGTGPVFSGAVFPFLFITVACGAVSGFHSLIASGTTPKMIENETQVRMIGYGAMLAESLVAVMALIAACLLEPGVYFAMNSPAGLIGTTVDQASQVISGWGFSITPDALAQTAHDVGESTILSRTGGAPTLAVGMAHLFSRAVGGSALMGFWYHFAILFEALFILTTVDAGTRVARFLIQDLLGTWIPGMRRTQSTSANLAATLLAVAAWGFFLYRGVVDPLGGVNTLWPLFGIANQMLAAIALTLCSVVLFKMKRGQVAWVAAAPTVWLMVCTLTAGWQKLFSSEPKIGFLAHARQFSAATRQGHLLAPAHSALEMHRVVVNDYTGAALCAAFVLVVIVMAAYGVGAIRRALADPADSMREVSAENSQEFGNQGPSPVIRCC